tara:strand:+ start:415 stop:729 length:315 start_codon:yes stop_codon:yes gene_type:complete
MKAIIILFTITFLQNDRIIGIWKSIDDENTKYLNFKSNGDLIEVGKNNIIKYDFIKKNNFIQIEMENGNITEQTYYINKDTLVIQTINQGKIIDKKFIKEKLAL